MNSLLLAVKANNVEEIQRLLTYSPSSRKLVNYQAPQNHETPLFVASVRGYTGVVRWLLNRGARVDIATSWGATALHAAAERGHDAIIKLLVEYRAPLHVQTQYGDTALHLAAYRGHHRAVILLLAAGIDTTIVNSKGRTAVDEAEIAGHQIVCKHLKCEKQSRQNGKDHQEQRRPSGQSQPFQGPAKVHAAVLGDRMAKLQGNPQNKLGFRVEDFLLPTSTSSCLDDEVEGQSHVQDWVRNSQRDSSHISLDATRQTSDAQLSPDAIQASDTQPAFYASPRTSASRRQAKLKFNEKSQSFDEGLCESTTELNMADCWQHQQRHNQGDQLTTFPNARRNRRVNSLERAVEELQRELSLTREEMERAKADVVDMQDMMRLCWAKGGVVVNERRLGVNDGLGQRFIISPFSSFGDHCEPADPALQSQPRKVSFYQDVEAMSE